jgi:hypothetical protein
MVTPVGELITYAKDNRNGYISSILAWVRMSEETMVEQHNFAGFQLYNPASSMLSNMTSTYKTALNQTIKCDSILRSWQRATYHGLLDTTLETDSVCDQGCGLSLKNWYGTVSIACAGQNITSPQRRWFADSHRGNSLGWL